VGDSYGTRKPHQQFAPGCEKPPRLGQDERFSFPRCGTCRFRQAILGFGFGEEPTMAAAEVRDLEEGPHARLNGGRSTCRSVALAPTIRLFLDFPTAGDSEFAVDGGGMALHCFAR
jgi:hypothetical protein